MTRPTTPIQGHSTKPIETPKRAELLAIKKLRDAKKLPLSNEDLFKHVGVSSRVGYRIFKDQPRQFHRNPYTDETRGRKPALSNKQVDQIVAFLKAEGYKARTLPQANLCDTAGLDFPDQPPSTVTIRKHLNQRGWKKYSAYRKFQVDYNTAALREAFAREALADYGLDMLYWRRIRYLDEVYFKFGPEGKVQIIRRSGERYNPDCIYYTQRPTEDEDRQVCLSAQAVIGYNFKNRLVWYSVENSTSAITLQAYRD